MEENWQKKLVKEFPYLYKRKISNIWDLLVKPSFGFECNSGWYKIIRQANVLLMYEVKKSDKLWYIRPYLCMFSDAWNNLMFTQPDWMKKNHIFGKFPRFTLPYVFTGYSITQVKEKYGSLRIYMNFETQEMSDITSMIETISELTCEQCGIDGKSRGKGWIYVSCNEHAREGDKDEDQKVSSDDS